MSHKLEKHRDKRGMIEDLKVGKDWSVTYITFKKGAIRGNHYHKETAQTDIILSGKLLVVSASTGKKESKYEDELVAGDEYYLAPGTSHAYKALEDSAMISICHGKRIGKNYEKDTFRLEKPLI